MFYSETLLSKTGPLARVWLSANLERKLSKNHILQSNIETSVSAIVDQGQAPLALRLSGQLLLGVVRIYSRKARYLLDDCNEAIYKIKMAFKSGNVDLPANQMHTSNPSNLVLPDVLTELDLLGPLPDPSLLLSQPGDDLLLSRPGRTLLDWAGSTQGISSSLVEDPRSAEETIGLEDDLGLELDIGEDYDPNASRLETDIEFGRDAPSARPLGDEFDETTLRFEDGGDLQLYSHKHRDSSLPRGLRNSGDGLNLLGGDDSTFHLDGALAEEPAHHQQRAKRRKVLQADIDTEIASSQIRAQQNDRSKILKPAAFLPRDPMLLALMEMQRNGSFVSSILGDGRSKGWAPELRGILSLEVIRGSTSNSNTSALKRKRDSTKPSRKDITNTGDPFALDDEARLQGDDAFAFDESNRFDDASMLPAGFDETTMPLLHPNDQGHVSQGTKHAVHLLRERFGGSAAADSPARRAKSSLLFSDLVPPRQTSRADATKMFFEVLVLATKDAVKVEQEADALGGPLRVRAKRGLWGEWAEMGAGGEIEQQEEEAQAEQLHIPTGVPVAVA